MICSWLLGGISGFSDGTVIGRQLSLPLLMRWSFAGVRRFRRMESPPAYARSGDRKQVCYLFAYFAVYICSTVHIELYSGLSKFSKVDIANLGCPPLCNIWHRQIEKVVEE